MSKNNKAVQLTILGILLVGTAIGTTILSLALAIAMQNPVIFKGYFSHPIIFILNFLPVLLLELAFYCICSRLWFAFGTSALLVFIASAGHFYKMKFRAEPFVFSDLSFVSTALGVSSEYDLTPNFRILVFGVYILITSIILLAISCKLFHPKNKIRFLTLISVIVLSTFLWCKVYASDTLYNDENLADDKGTIEIGNFNTQVYLTRGFVYPFIHSIKDGLADAIAPDGYNSKEIETLYTSFEDVEIPQQQKVNIIFFQLESFMDLTSLSIDGISNEAYQIYHMIRDQSLHGKLVVSTFGGGTITTEHSVLTGNSCYSNVWTEQPSFVRYLAENGYYTTGNHPMPTSEYNRDVINSCLLILPTCDQSDFSTNGQ